MSRLRERTTATLLIAIFMISIFAVAIPVSAQTTPTLDGVISSGEWGEVDFTIPSYEDHKVYVLNDLDYLYVAFVGEPGADYAIYGWTSICVYPGDDYAGKCWVYEPSGPGWSPDLTYYTTHHIQPPIVTEGELELSTNSVVEVGLNVMEWKIPLDEFSAEPGDTIAFDLYSYMDGFSSEETSWIYEVHYTLWAPEPEPEPVKPKRSVRVYWMLDLDAYNLWEFPHKLLVMYLDDTLFDEYYEVQVTIVGDDQTTLFDKAYGVFPRYDRICIYFPESLFTDPYYVFVYTDLGPVPYLVASRQGIEISQT